MLKSKQERHPSVTRKLVLPDIEPEDLSRARPLVAGRARRRTEIKEEAVEVV
jgi:hypothetical protein